MDLHNQTVLVAGLGGTGMASVRWCVAQGINVAAYDARVSPERAAQWTDEFPSVPLLSGSLAEALAGRDVLLLSPGISRRRAEIIQFEQQGGRVSGDVAVLAAVLRDRPDRILAITGSNGKTTVTSLIGHLCQACGCDTVVAGNIGTPVLAALQDRNGKNADFWVLELSSFQLETTPDLNAAAAVCLNVSEDHLDRYDDLLDYARAKDAIFNGSGVQVLNANDPFCRAMKRAGREQRWFSTECNSGYFIDGQTGALCCDGEVLLMPEQIPLQGRHNAANVLAALAVCEAVGLPRASLLAAVQTFQGLPHRVQKIAEKSGVNYIDDSKGTNVGATVAAMAGLPEKIVLIAGGQGKGQDFSPLREEVRRKARAVMLIGADADKVAAALADCGVPLHFCADLPEAVQRAAAAAHTGDTVLLSPACASLDMFDSYAHRGKVFAEAVNRLPD